MLPIAQAEVVNIRFRHAICTLGWHELLSLYTMHSEELYEIYSLRFQGRRVTLDFDVED